MIGSTTVGSLQSGLYYGYLALVDGILERLLAEMGRGHQRSWPPAAWQTLIGKGSKYIQHVDDLLTLDGLRIIWERNVDAKPRHQGASATILRLRPRPPRRPGPAASRAPAESSVENYFNYFTEIEEQFQRRRGGSLLLSTLDWALIETWKDAGIPLEAVLRGIDGAFERYEKRPTHAQGKQLGLLCAGSAGRRRRNEGSGGRRAYGREAERPAGRLSGPGHCGLSAAQCRHFADRETAGAPRHFRTGGGADDGGTLRELAAEMENTAPRLEDLERRLTVLEEKLFAVIMAATPDDEIVAVRAEADRELSSLPPQDAGGADRSTAEAVSAQEIAGEVRPAPIESFLYVGASVPLVRRRSWCCRTSGTLAPT